MVRILTSCAYDACSADVYTLMYCGVCGGNKRNLLMHVDAAWMAAGVDHIVPFRSCFLQTLMLFTLSMSVLGSSAGRKGSRSCFCYWLAGFITLGDCH